jgi:hypothetical protein
MSHDSCIKKLQSTLTFIEGKYWNLNSQF